MHWPAAKGAGLQSAATWADRGALVLWLLWLTVLADLGLGE